MFIDESRVCLDFTDRRDRVSKRPAEKFLAANPAQPDHYRGGSGMWWGFISGDGQTDQAVLNLSILTGQRLIDEV